MATKTKGPGRPRRGDESRHGKHAHPRKTLSGTAEQWEAWEAAAKDARMPWAEWARRALDAAARVRVR